MGVWLRGCFSWVVLVALVFGPGFGCAEDAGLVRQGRQSDWWGSHQQSIPRQRSSLWGSRGLSWGRNDHVRGAQRGSSTQRIFPTGDSAVGVQCGEDTMIIQVLVNFYGTGKLVKPSDLSVGPQRCPPTTQDQYMVTFQINLQDCGNTVQMNQDWLIYSTNLTYKPTSSIPIIRTNSAVVPITCYYYRHGNLSSGAIKPTWAPFSTTVSSEEKLSFSLQLMNADWSGPRSSPVFQLGEILYIQASVDNQNHMNMMLYVDRCVATTSPDISSAPSYDIITDNGCLVDGVQEDTSSAFIAPRVSPDMLQFTVDAFRFLGTDASLIYITCFLRAAAATQGPSSTNKACSYNKATGGWSAVDGPSGVCQCCQTLTCLSTANTPTLSGGRSGWFGRPRAFGKREALEELNTEGQTVTMLGPLLVTPPQLDRMLTVKKEESAPVELWVLVAVGCLSLLVVLACAVFIWKALKKSKLVSVLK